MGSVENKHNCKWETGRDVDKVSVINDNRWKIIYKKVENMERLVKYFKDRLNAENEREEI